MGNFITRRGLNKLEAVLLKLKTTDLRAAQEQVNDAREEGRLEENEGYLHAQEQCRMIEGRIAELEDSLSTLEVFEGPVSTDVVGFCSYVTIEDVDTGKTRVVQIVNEFEANISVGMLSINSPLGSILLGSAVDDEVELITPRGTTNYRILKIESSSF
jgi:transcription elongation factor GreA